MKKYISAQSGKQQARGVYRFYAQNRKLTAGMTLLAGMSLSISAVEAGIVLVPAPGNTATGNRSVVVTGLSNTASGNGSFVGSGVSHTASGFFSATLAGQSNTASGSLSSVVGGKLNLATAEASFVGGGLENRATGDHSGVLGGYDNKATAFESGVVGGRGNTADGKWTSVLGGLYNTATGSGAIVGGGSTNEALGFRSGVFTGFRNSATGNESAVFGGAGNVASGEGSIVLGGGSNFANGENSVVLGGNSSTASGYGSLIHGTDASDGGRKGNVILADSDPVDRAFRDGWDAERYNSYPSFALSDAEDKFTAHFHNGTRLVSTNENGVGDDNPPLIIEARETELQTTGSGLDYGYQANRNYKQMRFDGKSIQGRTSDLYPDQDDYGYDIFSYESYFSTISLNPLGGDVEIGSTGYTTTIKGTFVNASDWNIKEAIKPVSGKEVLERLVEMPVSTWRYKGGERGHIGPMAQDFHAAFNDLLDLNSDDKTIAPLDEAGIAFTSIQALHEIVEEKDAEIGALKDEQKALSERLEKLEALLSEKFD